MPDHPNYSAYEEPAKNIPEAKANNSKSLDLSSNNLTRLPAEIFQLTNLKMLDLRDNDALGIPEEMLTKYGGAREILAYLKGRQMLQ